MSLTDEQLIEMLTRGRNAAEVLLARMERYRAHSVTLNTVAFKLAEALGDIPHGQTWAEGDPVELADRLIAKVAEQATTIGWAMETIKRLKGEQPAHIPTLAAASTPGVWNVYCVACSDAAQDYVQVCTAGRWQAPAQLVAYDLLVQARGDAVDAMQMLADLTEPGEPISGVAPPPVQFGVRCADPSHPEGEHREVYSVTYVAHRLQPMANSIPCYELVFSRDGGRTWSEADGGSGS